MDASLSYAVRPDWAINTGPVALIFEGGGMRNAYTAAVLATLLEAKINFPKAYGVSAGAELAADYVARDAVRAKALFTQAPDIPESGGVFTFLTGRGFFNTKFMFEELAEVAQKKHNEAQRAGAGGDKRGQTQSPSKNERRRAEDREVAELWFDEATFLANPADVHIEALDLVNATTKAWTKTSMATTAQVMVRIAASCSYPVFTPQVVVDGKSYIDGGMGTSRGICLEAARRDGFERFFIVRTQPRGFRLPPLSWAKRTIYRLAYVTHRAAYQELLIRPARYDQQLDEIDELERQGVAYQFCPTTMPITYMTANTRRLAAAYNQGYEQAHRELPRLERWLNPH